MSPAGHATTGEVVGPADKKTTSSALIIAIALLVTAGIAVAIYVLVVGR